MEAILEDEFLMDNIVIYIGIRKVENFSYDSIVGHLILY